MRSVRIRWVWLAFTIPLIYWGYNSHNAPEWYLKKHYIKQILKQNDYLIDEVLIICERSKTEANDLPIYCINSLASYDAWFENNKLFIKSRPELKESIAKKLREVVNALSLSPEDKMANDMAIDSFNKCLNQLNHNNEQ